MAARLPEIKSSKLTLAKAIACAEQFDSGINSGEEDFYTVFIDVFDHYIIMLYHDISADSKHASDMDGTKIVGSIDPLAPVRSIRIRVGLAGFVVGIGIYRCPWLRGIFSSKDKKFHKWVDEDHLQMISMEKGDRFKGVDVKGLFCRLSSGIKAVQELVKADSGKDFMPSEKYGIDIDIAIDLPGWTKVGFKVLEARCEGLGLQLMGESGDITGITYKITKKHRLWYSVSEVEFLQNMIDGVNMLFKEDVALGEAHGI